MMVVLWHSLKGEEQAGHHEYQNQHEDENCNLPGGHQQAIAAETVVSRKMLPLAIRHDGIILHH